MIRNQKVIKISAKLFIDCCLRPIAAQTLVGDIPKDIAVRGAIFDPFTNFIEVLVESSGFPEVPEGEHPEGWRPEETRILMNNYDISVWELEAAVLRGRGVDDPELDPERIWLGKQDFIPRKGEEIQIAHCLYDVVKVSYDLEVDHICLLVVRKQ